MPVDMKLPIPNYTPLLREDISRINYKKLEASLFELLANSKTSWGEISIWKCDACSNLHVWATSMNTNQSFLYNPASDSTLEEAVGNLLQVTEQLFCNKTMGEVQTLKVVNEFWVRQ